MIGIIISIIVWSNYSILISSLTSNEIIFAIGLSLLTALTSTSIALIIGIPTAYTLSRYSFRGKQVIEVMLMLPFAMPPIALGATLLLFFTNTFIGRIANSILRIVFEVPGIIIAQFTVILPMIIKILKSSFDMIDKKYEAVARTLGYGKFMTLIKVLLPMCRRGLVASFILGFSRALGEFGASVTLAGATRFKTETLPIAIYLSLSSGDVELTVALVMILISIAFITLTILHFIERDRITVI